MYAPIVLLATLSCGQTQQIAQYVSTPQCITSRTDAWVCYSPYGYRLVPIINNYAPSIREEVDLCGRKTITYDYSKRIPHCPQQRTASTSKVGLPPPRVTESVTRNDDRPPTTSGTTLRNNPRFDDDEGESRYRRSTLSKQPPPATEAVEDDYDLQRRNRRVPMTTSTSDKDMHEIRQEIAALRKQLEELNSEMSKRDIKTTRPRTMPRIEESEGIPKDVTPPKKVEKKEPIVIPPPPAEIMPPAGMLRPSQIPNEKKK
jgi:hypothetical protein